MPFLPLAVTFYGKLGQEPSLVAVEGAHPAQQPLRHSVSSRSPAAAEEAGQTRLTILQHMVDDAPHPQRHLCHAPEKGSHLPPLPCACRSVHAPPPGCAVHSRTPLPFSLPPFRPSHSRGIQLCLFQACLTHFRGGASPYPPAPELPPVPALGPVARPEPVPTPPFLILVVAGPPPPARSAP